MKCPEPLAPLRAESKWQKPIAVELDWFDLKCLEIAERVAPIHARFLATLSALALAGCVTAPPAPTAAAPPSPAPTCASEAACTAQWAAARTFVLDHASYRIATYSPDFLQTFNPAAGDAQGLGAQVNREPLPGGGYTIRARFYCGSQWDCSARAASVVAEFNRTVAAAASGPPQANAAP